MEKIILERPLAMHGIAFSGNTSTTQSSKKLGINSVKAKFSMRPNPSVFSYLRSPKVDTKNLTRIDLKNVLEEGHVAITRKLSEFLSQGNHYSLREFRLDSSNSEHYEGSIKYLAKALGRLHSIENIQLKFSSCFKLTIIEAGQIFRSLGKCCNLRSLILDFSDHPTISASAYLQLLARTIKNLKQLECLNITLNDRRCINSLDIDNSLRLLFGRLVDTKLKTLTLCTPRVDATSATMVAIKDFVKAKPLSEIKFDFTERDMDSPAFSECAAEISAIFASQSTLLDEKTVLGLGAREFHFVKKHN